MMASQRMKLSPSEISQIASLQQRARVVDGTHHLLGGTIQRRLVAEGKHHLLSGEIQRKSSLKRAANGTLPGQGPKNPFWGGEIQRQTVLKQLKEGRHHSQQEWKCPHCATVGKGSAIYVNWHGDNCGIVNNKNAIYVNSIRYASKKHAANILGITVYELNKRLSA